MSEMKKPKEMRKPFERNMLRDMNEKTYVKKLENIIITEGKRILNSINVKYKVTPNKNITKFLESYPEFLGTTWYQIGFKSLFDYKRINTFQYQLLITMKQVLNKNNIYILRRYEFDDRKRILECQRYQQLKKEDCKETTCLQDECKVTKVCPVFYQNSKEWKDKQKEKEDDNGKAT